MLRSFRDIRHVLMVEIIAVAGLLIMLFGYRMIRVSLFGILVFWTPVFCYSASLSRLFLRDWDDCRMLFSNLTPTPSWNCHWCLRVKGIENYIFCSYFFIEMFPNQPHLLNLPTIISFFYIQDSFVQDYFLDTLNEE